ncbi:RNA polymerase-associated protein RTF1 [Babesia caballi]|uniref:RNA polymerase-associated protein RTF1 n=1 Tax=Babesia caballi TaxID=5871 RepID=A0AAV4LNV1_BABCB|nr:RNA polymerase-associated protein RTF1 [Babesia caballi]
MVLKLVRSVSKGDDHLPDQSPTSDGRRHLTDFQREMLLAEKHAESVRKRQRQNLFSSESSFEKNREVVAEPEEGTIEEDPFDLPNSDYVGAEYASASDIPVADASTLFADEVEHVAQAPVALVNKARVSKTRALHILEHPHCSKYLVGCVMRIWVTADAAAESVSSQYPNLINTHAIFKVERLLKAKEYPVYGDNVGNSCDHEIREFLGKTPFYMMGRVLAERASNALCRIGINDICSLPITQEEIKFGGEWLMRDLNQAATNLRNFTFTDEDVQLILERKLLKESSDQVDIQGGRSKLIAAIQRTSHEIELLTELVKHDPSKIDHLRALEERKAKIDEQLQSVKTPSRNPIFIKNCPVLRAHGEPSARGGAVRKTTQPTPMIMWPAVNAPETQNVFTSEPRKRERRSIADMSYEEQKELELVYITYMKNYDVDRWLSPAVDIDVGLDEGESQCNMISLSDYRNAA